MLDIKEIRNSIKERIGKKEKFYQQSTRRQYYRPRQDFKATIIKDYDVFFLTEITGKMGTYRECFLYADVIPTSLSEDSDKICLK